MLLAKALLYGWNPELLLLLVVLHNSNNLAVLIPNSSVFGTLYAIKTSFSLRNLVKYILYALTRYKFIFKYIL